MYKTITQGGDSLVEVKRSKFIGAARAVSSADEAEALIAKERKKYHDAKHHCSAYIIRGSDGAPDMVHSSDDGEPSGTAGAPILEVLRGAGLKDVALVVTRYFGGTLLGTGGLVRAYTEAARAALENSTISEMALQRQFIAIFDYTYTGSIDHLIGQYSVSVTDKAYTDKVSYQLAASEASYETIKKELVNLTSSSVTIIPGALTYTPVGSPL